MNNQYNCFPDSKKIIFPVSIIKGVYRSGKTFIGSLVGSFHGVEHIDEPWLPWMMPVMQDKHLIDKSVAVDILRAYTEELFYETISLRQGSLKPKDNSSYWKIKNSEEILFRLNEIGTRKEAKDYAEQNDSMLLYNLGGMLPYSKFLRKVFPSCKIVNVVRHGVKVAEAIEGKQWFSNHNLLKPFDSHLYRQYKAKDRKVYSLPWWVEDGIEESFLRLNDFSRGLYFWTRVLDINKHDVNSLREDKVKFMDLKLEDAIADIDKTVNNLSVFFDRESSIMTESLKRTVDKNIDDVQYSVNKSFFLKKDVPDFVSRKAKEYLEKYKYI
jgi:hypothetical protein